MITTLTTEYNGIPLKGLLITSSYNIEVRMREPILLAAPVQARLTNSINIDEAEHIGVEMLKYIYAGIMEVYRNKEAYQEELSKWESTPKRPLERIIISRDYGFYACEHEYLYFRFYTQLQDRGLVPLPAKAVGHILQAIIENPNSHLCSS